MSFTHSRYSVNILNDYVSHTKKLIFKYNLLNCICPFDVQNQTILICQYAVENSQNFTGIHAFHIKLHTTSVT